MFFSLILTLLIHQTLSTYNPLLVIVLMVKNEAHAIRETLQPFVDAGIQSYLIFDTGSTDDTVQITKDFFAQHNIQQGIIEQEPFIDFATSRNRALERAEEHFLGAGFMLMLDAEWHMHHVRELLHFCEQNKYKNCASYLVRITDGNLNLYAARLIRSHTNSRFVGAVHETLEFGTQEKVPSSCYFELRTTDYGHKKTKQRWVHDRDILLKEIEQDPTNARTAFYLAQTYDCLGDLEHARIWYEKRAKLTGWSEENFMTHYRLARVYQAQGNWNKALHSYVKAYTMRPSRIEPLVRIAQYYWDTGNHALCYFFARHAARVPYPHTDVLIVENNIYRLTRHDLLSRSAWYLGAHEIGETAARTALAAAPHEQYLKNMLAWYTNRSST